MRGAVLESGLAKPGECVLPAPVTVRFYPSPMRPGDVRRREHRDDLTLDQIVDELGLPFPSLWDLRIRIEGMRVPRAMWPHTRPNPGTTVLIHAVPHGGQTGKGVLQVVIGIALLATAFIAGPLAGTVLGNLGHIFGQLSTGTIIGLGIGGASLSAAGAFSLAAPPPGVPFRGEIPSSASRTLTAPRNEVRPFSPVPRVFGRYRVFPQYAAKPFTELVGNDQFLRMLFTFGYGPLEMADLKIGEDLVDNLVGVEWNFLPGYDDDPALSLFTVGVDEAALQVSIDVDADPVIRTTELDSHEASIDLAFPKGLLALEEREGPPKAVTAHFTIQYRTAGSSDPWVGVVASDPLGPGVSNPTAGEISIASRDQGSVIRGIRWVFPAPGQYEIRISRTASTFNTNNLGTLLDDCVWTKLRSIRPGTKPRVPNLSLLEVRIRATDQLSGIVQNLSAVVTSILPVWNSIDEWGPSNRHSSNLSLEATRNPAWAMAEMLRGGVNARPVPDSNVDAESLAAWAIANDAAGRSFDAVMDFDTTVGQVCRDIAGAHRASFNVIDGRYGVVIDEPKAVVSAHFSQRDTGNFSASRIFNKDVHGLRVRFVSPDAGYEPEELVVYADGYDESNATEFGELDLWGITDPDVAYRDGRYHLAAGKLRPEIYSFDLDIAQLAITRGDRVLYSHDVMLVGLGSARVVDVFTSGSNVTAIELDEEIDYDPALDYCVRVRSSATGETELHPVYNLGTPYALAVFTTPIASPTPLPAVGDLVAWGEQGRETGDYIVSGIVPTSDLGARVELIDHAPEIFTSDTGPIPPFDPNITVPTPRSVAAPSRPTIDSVISDESVLVISPDGTTTPRIVVDVGLTPGDEVPAESIEVQYRTAVPVGEWRRAAIVSATARQASITNVDTGEAYDIRVRAVSRDFIASDWAQVNGHAVVGSSTLPPDVESVRVGPDGFLVWDYPDPPRDLAGFRVRHQAGSDTTWISGIPAHDGIVTETRFDLSGIPSGSRTILVKAVDLRGNESATAASVIRILGGTVIENVLESEDFHAAGFPGTKTACTVEGGSGDLIADATDTKFYASAGAGDFFSSAGGGSFYGGGFQAMAYEDSWTPNPASVPGRLFLTESIAGESYSIFYRVQGASTWLRWPGVIDAEPSTTYEFRIEIAGGATQGRVSEFAAVIDVPDIEETIAPLVVPATGVFRIPITLAFQVIKHVAYDVLDDGNGGATVIRLDSDAANGPSVRVEDSSGARVQGLVGFRVRGY